MKKLGLYVNLFGFPGGVAPAILCSWVNETPAMMTVYEQIGGGAAVDDTVELLYDKVLADDLLAPFFKNSNVKRLRGMQKQFLNHVLGGLSYNGQSMKKAHSKLGLENKHFERVLKLLGDSMTELGVPEPKVKDVLAIAETTRDDVLGRESRANIARWPFLIGFIVTGVFIIGVLLIANVIRI